MDTRLKKVTIMSLGVFLGIIIMVAAMGGYDNGKNDSESTLSLITDTSKIEGAELLGLNDTQDLISLKIDVMSCDSEWVLQAAPEGDMKTAESSKVATPVVAPVSKYAGKFITNLGDDFLNIRAEASTEAELIGKIYKGGGGEVLETLASGWTKITSGSVTGYVATEFIVTDPKTIEEKVAVDGTAIMTITCDELRVRTSADLQGDIIGFVNTGDVYERIGISDDAEWYQINYAGTYAYINYEFVTIDYQLGKAISREEEEAAIRAEQERLAEIARQEEIRKAQEKQALMDGAAGYGLNDRVAGNSYGLTGEDAYLIAALVVSESRYESYEGKLAVANVVINRWLGGYYGSTISDVIYYRNAFSVVSMGVLANNILNGIGNQGFAQAVEATVDAIKGNNNVPQYANFCSYKIADYASYSEYLQIGNHVFYRR